MNSFTGVSVQRFCTRCFYVIAVNWNIWRTKAWIGKHDFFWYKGIVLVKQIYFGCLNVLVFIFQINFFFKIFYFFRIYFSPAFILWGGIWLMPAGIYLYKFNSGSTRRMSMSSFWCLLYEKCSNRKFFLVRIFRIWTEHGDLLRLQFWTDFRHCFRVSIFDFVQLDTGWADVILSIKYILYFQKFTLLFP